MSTEVRPVPTVGVGASAGGVDALERLLRHTPADTGLAFVVVTHLSPDRESLLPEILARFTDMTVLPVEDGLRLAPDTVYVLPRNALVGVEDGRLTLRPLEAGRRERKPIDIFFATLGKALGECSAGVVLSGDDGDGALGIKAIKERGGLTFAQTGDGDGPSHPDMPQSAIASGLVDFALPAEEMGARFAEFARSLKLLDGLAADQAEAQADAVDEASAQARKEIYGLLRTQIGHDFSGYKTRTFTRRVQRRMQVTGLETMEGYVERLRQEPAEVAALFRDLLINVTNFFRDADAFEALGRLVVPKLFEGKGAEHTVRVWVPGCATGEEVYSLAMLMREHMDGLRGVPRVQIFGTDIDDHSLSTARGARYPDALLDSVSPERRARFFTQDGAAYVVAKEVRDMCIFSPHSVIRDPPFSRIDLVSCRNLLIYFGPAVQEQVIPIFHYSLRPAGHLFLGTSENVSRFSDLFSPVEKSQRIFRAREDGQPHLHLPLLLDASRRQASLTAQPGAQSTPPLRQSVETHVLERFSPPHVVVNTDADVVYYSANTGKYLEAAAGAPSRALLLAARKGLRLALRSALREAMDSGRPAVRERVALESDQDRVQLLTLTVDPMIGRPGEALYVVAFADTGPMISREDALGRAQGGPDDMVVHLERELRDTRERLQSMIEEYETALEELKSSNEELVSVNEELQSTNEELEASKEELQSLNEELSTVNIELNRKVDALDEVNSDMNNLFESTQVATIFLDERLTIRSFTPSISQLFSIRASDRGRFVGDFAGRLDYPAMQEDLAEVLATGRPREARVRSADGRSHYLARMRGYDASHGETRGVVATFVDVTDITEAEAHQRVLIAELNHRVKNMLAVVIALARQTAKTASSTPQFTSALILRLQSMSRAYELLSRESWTQARVDELARQELEPFGMERVRLEGPPVTLKPKTALSLAMVLHELATNAAKYGALSNPAGRILVSWRRADAEEDGPGALHLAWREEGGPPVAEPQHRGFGLRLVEREAAHGLNGAARIDWEPSGLAVDLDLLVEP